MLLSAGARPGHWSCWVQGDLFSDDAQLPARVPTRRRWGLNGAIRSG